MKDGIYLVTFRSNMQGAGEGTVVVKNNIINGGDIACVYTGRINGDVVTLRVDAHDKARTSVFGAVNSFSLILKVAPEISDGYYLSGYMDGAPQTNIIIQAKRIGELLE